MLGTLNNIRLGITHFILLFFIFSILSSCLNKYEKKILGYYEVKEYQWVDTINANQNNFPTLTLNKNHDFLLNIMIVLLKVNGMPMTMGILP